MNPHTNINGASYSRSMEFEINKIKTFIEEELNEKRELLRQKDKQISELKTLAGKKDQTITTITEKLKELEDETNGNRQLINKLLGDISKLRNDIEWYKRTYEKRSFLGVIKEKILKK